ncbi:hypothetical protein GLOTRDRAFT_111686 [Gloeophyllum trabeum ATCC 11539]|uniref:Uncharacterized protein n=1 Tax=Gloeophyllum trabeum (strain ATCC 11539 / FP-39264 / Madison 617) TaxID=670483 RepID=S7RLH5_GLOTA|nr:uncharacterized protein GLOTRDRAFT_111686 [Gloeophyllum trabeum ATCC 11539]EPQ53509.1 hypothetical protein GLOTRDRAFT_111686 [Gloeophyllum trabeum ATCC 11539]
MRHEDTSRVRPNHSIRKDEVSVKAQGWEGAPEEVQDIDDTLHTENEPQTMPVERRLLRKLLQQPSRRL